MGAGRHPCGTLLYISYKVPLRDVGDVKSRGRRKPKGESQVTHVLCTRSIWASCSTGYLSARVSTRSVSRFCIEDTAVPAVGRSSTPCDTAALRVFQGSLLRALPRIGIILSVGIASTARTKTFSVHAQHTRSMKGSSTICLPFRC